MRKGNKRANNALQVLGKVTDTQYQDVQHSGTPRDGLEGGCYRGDGTAYVSVPGLLSTDTAEYLHGGDTVNVLDNVLGIPDGNNVHSVRILRGGTEWALYKMDEKSGTTMYDSSGNGNHGTITDAITVPKEENPNSIHQRQDIYSWQNTVGYSENIIINSLSKCSLSNFNPVPDTKVEVYGRFISTGSTEQYVVGSEGGASGKFRFGVFNNSWYANVGDSGIILGSSADTNFHKFELVEGEGLYVDEILDISISNPITSQLINELYIGCTTGNVKLSNFEYSYVNIYVNNTLVREYTPNNSLFVDRLSGQALTPITTPNSIYIPRNESIQLPPFKDVLGNDLQYIGHCQNNADWVNSGCMSNQSGSATGGLVFNIPVYNGSAGENITAVEFLCYVGSTYTTDGGFAEILGRGATDPDNIYIGRYSTSLYLGRPVDGTFVNIANYWSTGGSVLPYGAFDRWVRYRVELDRNLSELRYYADGYLLYTASVDYTSDTDLSIYSLGAGTHKNHGAGDFVNFKIESTDNKAAELCLQEPIIGPANHTYFDKSGNGNHATLVNGSLDNYGRQNEYHDLMVNGFSLGSRWSGLGGITSPLTDFGSSGVYQLDYAVVPYNTNFNYFNTVIFEQTNGNDNAIFVGRSQIAIRIDGTLYSYSAALSVNIISNIRLLIDRGGNFEVFINDFVTPVYSVDISSQSAIAWEPIQSILGGLSNSTSNAWVGEVLYGSLKRDGVEYLRLLDDSANSTLIYIPASSVDPTKDALGNPLTHPQDGTKFLDCGTKLRQRPIPELIQADNNLNVWFDTSGTPKTKNYASLRFGNFSDKYFTGNKIEQQVTPISVHNNKLVRAQLDTEERVRNVGDSDLLSEAYLYYPFNNSYSNFGTATSADLTEEIVNGQDLPITFVGDRFGNSQGAVYFSNTLTGATGGKRLKVDVPTYSGDYTVSFWINMDTIVVNNCGVFESDETAGNKFDSFRNFQNDESSANSIVTGIQGSTLLDRWSHHCIRIKADGTTDYFEDGVKIFEGQSGTVSNVANIALGWGTGGAPYNGAIDDLIIIKRLVTDQEVHQLAGINL